MRHYFQAGSIQCCGGKCSVTANDEEKEKKVDEIQGANEEEIEKQKRIEADKDEIRKLDDDQLMALLEKMSLELDEIRKQKDEQDGKQSKSASSEYLGVNNDTHKISKYSVLTLQDHNNKTSGDELLIRLGSTDDQSNSTDDDLLKSLGSTDD